MENIFEQITLIKTLMEQAGYKALADDILDQQLCGGTAGEVLMLVCARLLGVKEKYTNAYSVVESEANSLIKYCRSIGMFPFPSYPK
jgi:hypothetical protein